MLITRDGTYARARTRVGAARRSPLARPLAAQFADGFGGKFNSLVLALYALRVSGIGAFSGLLAVGMLGSVLSAVASSVGTSRLGGSRTMRASSRTLAAARVAAYVVILARGAIGLLFAARFVGGIAAGVVMAAAKSQAPRDERAAASLAWLNVTNGAGQAVGAGAAGALAAWGPLPVFVASGATVGLLSIVPMYRLARHAVPTAVPVREQLRGHRHAAPVVAFGALVYLVAMSLVGLSDALVVRLQSEAWLGMATAAAFGGALLAASMLRARPQIVDRDPTVLWPMLGVLALAGWQVADQGWGLLLATVAAGGFAGQMLAAMVEHHVLHRVEPAHASSALATAGAVGSLASAIGLAVVPNFVDRLGVEMTAGLLVAVAVAVAIAASGARRWRTDVAAAGNT